MAKFSVGVGPGVELTLEALLPMGELGTAVSVTLQGGIEVPKIETSFSTDESSFIHPETAIPSNRF